MVEKYDSTEVQGKGVNGCRSRQERDWHAAYFDTTRKLFPKRPVTFKDFPKFVVDRLKIQKCVKQLEVKGDINDTIVRHFYATLVKTDDSEFEAYVRGVKVKVNAESLKEVMFGVKNPQLYCFPITRDTKLSKKALVRVLAPGKQWTSETLKAALMPNEHRLLNLISVSAILPTSHTSTLRSKHAHLLYALLSGNSEINYPRIVIDAMREAATSIDENSVLPFPFVVTRLCAAARCPTRSTDRILPPATPVDRTSIRKCLGHDYEPSGKRPRVDDAESSDEEIELMFEDEPPQEEAPQEVLAEASDIATLSRQMASLTQSFHSFEDRYSRDMESFQDFRGEYRRDMGMVVQFQHQMWSMQYPDAALPPFFYNPYPPRDPNAPGPSSSGS